MTTLSDWECYRSMSWTTDNDECENACGRVMGPDAYVEGARGHYCSHECRDESEYSYEDDYREDFHADG